VFVTLRQAEDFEQLFIGEMSARTMPTLETPMAAPIAKSPISAIGLRKKRVIMVMLLGFWSEEYAPDGIVAGEGRLDKLA
jgi:hypothetical protein